MFLFAFISLRKVHSVNIILLLFVFSTLHYILSLRFSLSLSFAGMSFVIKSQIWSGKYHMWAYYWIMVIIIIGSINFMLVAPLASLLLLLMRPLFYHCLDKSQKKTHHILTHDVITVWWEKLSLFPYLHPLLQTTTQWASLARVFPPITTSTT